MKSKSSNYIGINQRIPIGILDSGLHNFLLNGEINKIELQKGLSDSITGKNRMQKAVMHCINILTKPKPIIAEIQKHFNGENYINLEKKERNIILLSLIAFLYPMAYQLLVSMAEVFKDQPTINTKLLTQKMSSLYGSNRALELGMYALLPMFIELELIQRIKRGNYEKNTPYSIVHPVIKEIYLYIDIYFSDSKSIVSNEIQDRPWFFYNSVSMDNQCQTNLLQYQDGIITVL